jgi:DNA-binding NarL/FixJ family response regulator
MVMPPQARLHTSGLNRMSVLSFAPDLMIRSKIDVAARHYGVIVRHVSSAADFAAAFEEEERPRLVLIDLDLEGIDAVGLVREARNRGAGRVVGFCSHVMTDLIRESRAAGAHTVMANSTFSASIPGLMAELADQQARQPAS